MADEIKITIEQTVQDVKIVVAEFTIPGLISSDANNALVLGSDKKLFVPISGGGGGGTTNLSKSTTKTTNVIGNDNGSGFTLNLGNGTDAGLSENNFTDAEKTVIGNTSNTNTGDETTITILNKIGNGSTINPSYLPAYVDDVLEFANFAALPVTGEQGKIYVTIDDNSTYRWTGSAYVVISNPLSYASQLEAEANTENTKVMTALRVFQNWFYNVSNYTLTALNTTSKTIIGAVNELFVNKIDKNTPITGATKTKVTYDSKGLVTSGTDATTADIADSTNKRYQTDNQKLFNDATSSIQTQFNNLAIVKTTLTTSTSITTSTTTDEGLTQEGRINLIKNSTNAINLTVNGINASYQKGAGSTGVVTFIQGSGRTLVLVDGTSTLSGTVGSTATLTKDGTTDFLRISNA